ncbi:MAG: hypothetical protein QM831_02385 [Kofleriaceae bacterium]
MPTRPDLREIASNVKDAFSEMDRDALLEILTFVVKEYVVEGPPPMLLHQAETLSDLKNISFAQLITSLQTRFDFPELQMFVVDGEQVSVRINGVVQPLLAPRNPPAGIQMVDTRPQPGTNVQEVPARPRPPGPTNPSQQPGTLPAGPAGSIPAPSTREAAAAPPPSRGLSIRGAPTGGAGGGAPASGGGNAPAPAATPAAPAAAAPAPEEKKPEGGDDASARFSLLELD